MTLGHWLGMAWREVGGFSIIEVKSTYRLGKMGLTRKVRSSHCVHRLTTNVFSRLTGFQAAWT